MEINYELIIKYLVKKTTVEFTTQKNLFNYSTNFPNKFKNIFGDKFYRFGVTVNDKDNNNISFWSSLLTLINKNFLIPYDNDEINTINQFKNELLDKITSNKKNKVDKQELRERIKLNPDVSIFQFIVDILDINFIIFDFVSEEILCVYPNAVINPFKQTLLFSKYNELWEPIMVTKNKSKTQRLFSYNDNIIKKLLNECDIKYFGEPKFEKSFVFNNDINSFINKEKNNFQKTIPESEKDSDNGSVHTSDSSDNVFVEKDDLTELKKIKKTVLNKMKLSELLDLTNKYKIIVSKENPTRSLLIDIIMTKINS